MWYWVFVVCVHVVRVSGYILLLQFIKMNVFLSQADIHVRTKNSNSPFSPGSQPPRESVPKKKNTHSDNYVVLTASLLYDLNVSNCIKEYKKNWQRYSLLTMHPLAISPLLQVSHKPNSHIEYPHDLQPPVPPLVPHLWSPVAVLVLSILTNRTSPNLVYSDIEMAGQ